MLANDRTATIDIDKALPKKVLASESPRLPQFVRVAHTMYSPLQKASIVELKLTITSEPAVKKLAKEEKSTVYSPIQKARIVELELTAE